MALIRSIACIIALCQEHESNEGAFDTTVFLWFNKSKYTVENMYFLEKNSQKNAETLFVLPYMIAWLNK